MSGVGGEVQEHAVLGAVEPHEVRPQPLEQRRCAPAPRPPSMVQTIGAVAS